MHASLVEYFSTPIKYPNVATKAGLDLGFKKPQNQGGFRRLWCWFWAKVGFDLDKR